MPLFIAAASVVGAGGLPTDGRTDEPIGGREGRGQGIGKDVITGLTCMQWKRGEGGQEEDFGLKTLVRRLAVMTMK